MISDILQYMRPGGDPYPALGRSKGVGTEVTLIGAAAVPFGTVVLPATDDNDPLFDAGLPAGERSSMQTVKLPEAADQATFEKYGLFGAVVSEEGIQPNLGGWVVPGFMTLGVRTQMPVSGGLAVNTPLMHDWTNPGTLTVADGTGKCIALVAGKVNGGAGVDGVELIVTVRFNGTYGFGG